MSIRLIGLMLSFGGALAMTLVRYQISEPPVQAQAFTHIAFLLVFAAPALWVLAALILAPGTIRPEIILASGGAVLAMGFATLSPLGLLLVPGGVGLVTAGLIGLNQHGPAAPSTWMTPSLILIAVVAAMILLYTGGTEACWREVISNGERSFERESYAGRMTLAPGESAMYCTERAPTMQESVLASGVSVASVLAVALMGFWQRK